jgi:hypothetical protein
MKLALAALAAVSLSGLAACSGVHSATRPGASAAARDASLVEVRQTGFDGAYRIVSFSTWDVDPSETLPAEAPTGVVDDMRSEAAAQGAELLLVERWDDPYRKAYYGIGAIKDALASRDIPTCGQPTFDAAIAAARATAASCVREIRARRPQMRGSVTVAFEIDPDGKTLRAAPTPESSRDSEFQACVVEAVYATEWGAPLQFSCQARIGVDSVDGVEPATVR